MPRPGLPPLAFAACACIWGSTFLAIRVGNETLPALWACSLRLGMAGGLLALCMLATRQPWPKGAALTAAVWYGFLEFGVGLPLLYWGERFVPSGLAAVLYAICPVTAMIGAKALGMEHWNPRKLGAGLFALAGVAIIFWREVVAGTSPSGFASIILAATVAPMAILMLQRGPRQNAVGANAVGAVVGLPFALCASWAIGEAHPMPATLGQAFPVVYLAIMSSVIAFGIFAWLVNHWKATTISFLGVIVPVIGVIVGAVVKQERFAPGAAYGGAIVLIGVVIALRSEAASQRTVAHAES